MTDKWGEKLKERYRVDPVFREQRKEYAREYYRLNKTARLEYGAKRRASFAIPLSRSALGLTPADIEAMREAQEGRCAICTNTMTERNEHLDHDHETGRVRGLLCATCNKGLGLFRDNPTSLRAAADYLER